MRSGERVARLHPTGAATRIVWRDGRITEIRPAPDATPGSWWLLPPLVDLQVNGFAGVDFQRDDTSAADLARAAQALATAGCDRFLLTLITDDWPRLLARLERLRRLRAAAPGLAHALAGWHLEGPFLSAEPGYHGAHDPAWMIDPTPAHLEELRAVAGDDPVLLTLAPERPGAIGAIRRAVARGIQVSLGHTNANPAQLHAAIAAGARGFTHLGNACPQQLDRHDNILWRVLDTASLTVSLIPDGRHVAPPLFRLVHRLLGDARILYVTDAMAAAGAPPGRFTLGPLDLEAGADGVVRQPGGTNFAGSALRPVDGVFRAAQMRACPWTQAWSAFSVQPARFMGWPDRLCEGGPADFCLARSDGAAAPPELELFRAGEQVV